VASLVPSCLSINDRRELRRGTIALKAQGSHSTPRALPSLVHVWKNPFLAIGSAQTAVVKFVAAKAPRNLPNPFEPETRPQLVHSISVKGSNFQHI
jgi:hypothetical protein